MLYLRSLKEKQKPSDYDTVVKIFMLIPSTPRLIPTYNVFVDFLKWEQIP